jgi:serine protease Do
MKAKYFLGAILMAVIGSLVTIIVYTGIINKKQEQNFSGNGNSSDYGAMPVSMSEGVAQPGPVDFTYAADHTIQAVVHVKVISTVPGEELNDPITEFFYGHDIKQPPQKMTGYGSGVIIEPDGYIITNNHVVEGSDSIGVILNNKQTFRAKLIGRDPDTDLALIKINARSLPVIKFGNSDNLHPGQWVLAVGNPFNLGTTVTAGIISAIGRSLQFPDDDSFKIDSYIQTDAALNPGNSGGALVNPGSELVGITSAIISPTGAYSGNSFAIPVNIVKKVAGDLRQYGKVQRAFLGISITEITPELAAKEKLRDTKGVFVADVAEGSGAAEAGLKDKDIILKVENTYINSPSDFQEIIGTHKPGDKVNITYKRGGSEKTVLVVLKNVEGTVGTVKPGMESSAFAGASLKTLPDQEKSKLGIDSGVRVASIGDGKLKEIGIKKGDIITSINGKAINSTEEARMVTNEGKNFVSIAGIQSNGTRFMLQF